MKHIILGRKIPTAALYDNLKEAQDGAAHIPTRENAAMICPMSRTDAVVFAHLVPPHVVTLPGDLDTGFMSNFDTVAELHGVTYEIVDMPDLDFDEYASCGERLSREGLFYFNRPEPIAPPVC